MKKRFTLFLTVLLIFICNCVPVFAKDTDWVYDEVGVVSDDTINYVTNLNENVFPNYKNKPQLGIYIVDKLPEGYTMDEYKLEVFNHYGVGTKDENCGLLFVMAISDRKYGLEIGDGFAKGSLLRRDLETDFITNDMKNLMRNGDYDHAILQIVQHLECIMSDEENGIYAAREAEAIQKQAEAIQNQEEKARQFINSLKFLGIGALVIGIATIITFVVKERKFKKYVNYLIENYSFLVKYVIDKNNTEEKLKDDLYKCYFIKDILGANCNSLTESEFLHFIYNEYKNNMYIQLKMQHLDWDSICYKEAIDKINNFDNFVKNDITDLDDIIKKVDEAEKRKFDIHNQNADNIAKYINEQKINTKAVSKKELKKHMLSHEQDFILMSDKNIKSVFEKEYKELQFKYEYEQFLKEHSDDIDSRYFNGGKFYEEVRKSKEYNNYSGGRINDNAWMLLLLTHHMHVNEKRAIERQRAEERCQEELRRQEESYSNYSSSSFGSSFGGGMSSGGGFSGGW